MARQKWEKAPAHVARTVNTAMVKANWLIGRQTNDGALPSLRG